MAKTTKDTIAAWQNYGGNEQAHHHTTQLRAALVAELAIAETLAVDVERVVARQTLAWTEALRAACKAADEALDALL